MSNTILAREDADREIDLDESPPHPEDFDITDLQHWIDLCA